MTRHYESVGTGVPMVRFVADTLSGRGRGRRVREAVRLNCSPLKNGRDMSAMAIPLLPDKVDAWRAWIAELNGPRKSEFEASNARHQLTSHHAWLQNNPDGSQLVIAVHEGPGGDNYMNAMGQSNDPFDQWFMRTVAEAHGMDASAPPPPPAEQVL